MSLQIQRMASPKLLHLCCCHGGDLFNSQTSQLFLQQDLPHIWPGSALFFGSSQSRLLEGTPRYLVLRNRCNTTPCFNFFQQPILVTPTHISSQFQPLFSCFPDSKRRRRMMSWSSQCPVEGVKNISAAVENIFSLLRMVLDLLALAAQLSGKSKSPQHFYFSHL